MRGRGEGPAMTSTEELYQVADELRAIACQGLHFEGNRYVSV